MVQAVPQRTRVTLVLAPMGRKSLCHLGSLMSWASSASSRMLAVAPTTLAAGSALKKRAAGAVELDDVALALAVAAAVPAVVEAVAEAH